MSTLANSKSGASPAKLSERTEQLQAINIIGKAPVGAQIKHVVDLLFEKRQAFNSGGSQPSLNYVGISNQSRRGDFANNRGRGRYSSNRRVSGFHRGVSSSRGMSNFNPNGGIICQICFIAGHSANRCWRRFGQDYASNQQQQHSQPRNTNFPKSNYYSPKAHLANLRFTPSPSLTGTSIYDSGNYNSEKVWYPDSGATNHVSPDLSNLDTGAEYHGNTQLMMGNGQGTHIAHIVILVLQYSQFGTAAPPANDNINPISDACETPDVCGKGTCVHVTNNTLGFVCECEPGWRQARLDEDVFLSFLPCVFPNCTVNYTCTENQPPPDYDYQGRTNISSTDPCYVQNCGGGRCNITSPFTRSCLCEEGFFNLLNSTAYPCYRLCAFGDECPGLGFSTNATGVNPFAPIYNHAASLIGRGEFACMVTMVVATLVRPVWNIV